MKDLNKCYEVYKDLPLKIMNKHYKHFLMNYSEDLKAQSYVLLFQAYKNYDETKGAKFETYAYSYIYYGLGKYLDENLQSHQRRNVKQKDGHFKMVVDKPAIVYMDKTSNTQDNETVELSFFQGKIDEGYNVKEMELFVNKIKEDLREKAKIEKRYEKCDLILDLIYNNTDMKMGEIIKISNIHHNTFYRKLKCIREVFKKYYEVV